MIDAIPPWLGTALAATGLVAVVAFIKAYRYVHEFRGIFKEIGLHELPSKPWTGAWSLWMNQKDLFQLEIDLVKEHGKVFGYFEGRQPTIMVADIDLLKHVLIKDFDHFCDRRNLVRSRKNVMNFALTTLSGARWRHVRQQLTPAFTPANLRRMEPLLKQVANQLASNVSQRVENGQSIDIKEFAGCFSLDAVASVAFALDLDSFTNPNSPFVTHAKALFKAVPINSPFLSLLFMFPDIFAWLLDKLPASWLPFGPMFKFYQKAIENEIARRKADENGVQRYDFLALVIPLEKDLDDPANKQFLVVDEVGSPWLRNGITRDELLAQAIIFFLAGYETTATSLTMCLLALSQNPDIQERLYRDLAASFRNPNDLTIESLNEVKYLEMVVNETLRFYTPVLRADRKCVEDTEYNGMKIPKGVVVTFPINAIHHDPELWPEPEKFDPERFSPENADRVSSIAFIPFGSGNRNCIGMRLAMVELKLAVAYLVLQFKFNLSPETELPIRWLPTGFRTPASPIMLQAEKRMHTIS